MNVAPLRKEFLVYVISRGNTERLTLKRALTKSGYRVEDFTSGDEALTRIKDNPPHVVLALESTNSMGVIQFLDLVTAISPDILFIPVLSPLERELSQRALERGAHDVIWYFSLEFSDVLIRIDRAVETLYYRFENEQLHDSLKVQEAHFQQEFERQKESTRAPEHADLQKWYSLLDQAYDAETLIKRLLEIQSSEFGGVPAIYLKYLMSFQSFALTHHVGVTADLTRSIGISLKEKSLKEIEGYFEHTQGFPELQKMMTKVFHVEKFSVMPLVVDTFPNGFFILFDELKNETDRERFEYLIRLGSLYLNRLELKKSLFESTSQDMLTGVLNRRTILTRVEDEIKRAFRIKIPVCLIHAQMDDYEHYWNENGAAATDTAVRMIASVFKKTGRRSDCIGRLKEGEFLMILPHTPKMGGALKAERLRRLVEGTQFPGGDGQPLGRVTMSCGVSVYPDLAADADTLIGTAVEAGDRVRSTTKNRVCLYSLDEDDGSRRET